MPRAPPHDSISIFVVSFQSKYALTVWAILEMGEEILVHHPDDEVEGIIPHLFQGLQSIFQFRRPQQGDRGNIVEGGNTKSLEVK